MSWSLLRRECSWQQVLPACPLLQPCTAESERESYLQSACQCRSGVPDSLSGGCQFWFGQCLSLGSVLDGCWLFTICFPCAVTFPSCSLVSTEGVWVIIASSSGILLVECTALASAGTQRSSCSCGPQHTPSCPFSSGTDFPSVYLGAFKVPFCSFLEGS